MTTIASRHDQPAAGAEPRLSPPHVAPASLVDFLRAAADLLLGEIEQRTREPVDSPPSPLLEAVERSPACLFCCDAEGRLAYVSPGCAGRLSGGAGTALRDAVPGEIFARLETPLRRSLAGEAVELAVPAVGHFGWNEATSVRLEPHRFADGGPACLAFMSEGAARAGADLAQSGKSAGALEVELEAQADDVQRVLEAVADAIVTVDADGSIKGMNAAAEKLFKTAAARLHDRHFAALLPDLGRSTAAGLLEQSRTAGGLDAEARDAEGRSIPIHMTVSVATHSTGRQLILAIRDFRAARAAQQRVLASQRLAAIGETMTALAHESRNALQRIQSCLTLLQLKVDSDETQALVADMQDAQDQLQRLYEEVNNFAAPIKLRPHRVDVNRLVDRTWHELHPKWKDKRLELVKESAVDDARAWIDSARMGQVFRNLLENAIDASPEGGRVWVALTEERNEQRAGVQLTIRDEGDGMPIDVEERAFDLLFTTKEWGTGMGLAIARRIVQEHDGTLTITKSDSGGTTVALRLPRDGDP